MRTLIMLLILLAMTSGVFAQQTRTKVDHPAASLEDSRPNSDTVPSAVALSGQFERIMVVRLKYQTDVLAGLDSVVHQQKIQNAAILFGIGSVRHYRYHVVSNRTFPPQNLFVEDPSHPADLLNMNGFIIDGRIHAHMTLADGDRAFGGHLEPGTQTFTFVIITIGIFKDGINLRRVDDLTYR